MPKSFTAVSLVAIALVVFGLALSPRIHPTQVATTAVVSRASTTPPATEQKTRPTISVKQTAAAAPTVAQEQSTSSSTIGTSTAVIVAAPVTDAKLLIDGTPLDVVSGESVLDAMHALQVAGKMTFVETDYPGLGAFIDSINGKENAGGMYWFLYVNGKPSGTGASQTRIQPGDSLEWKYRDSY